MDQKVARPIIDNFKKKGMKKNKVLKAAAKFIGNIE